MATPHLTESRVACPRCCTAPVCPACGAPCPICHGSGTAAGICALCDGPVAGARVPCRCSPSRKPAPGPLGFSVGRAAFHRDCFFRA